MDNAFDQRKKAHEDKWAHDEALRFKVSARRNKLVGLWAAAELGHSGDAAEAYAKSVVVAEMHTPGGDNVFRKVRADFDAGGVTHSDHVVRRKIEDLTAEAAEQVLHEKHAE